MRLAAVSIISCLSLFISGYVFAASCMDSNRREPVFVEARFEGGSPIQSYCQCTDPLCDKRMYTDCISRAYCCEAFGNIGGR